METQRYAVTPKLTDKPGEFSFALAVKVYVAHPSDAQKRRVAIAIIDTTRSHTTVPNGVVRALGLHPKLVRSVPEPRIGCSQLPVFLVGAAGEVLEPPVLLDVHFHAEPDVVFLGTDFLNHFRLQLLPDRKEFILRRLPKPRAKKSQTTVTPSAFDLIEEGGQQAIDAWNKARRSDLEAAAKGLQAVR
jgi:hypothetical protein